MERLDRDFIAKNFGSSEEYKKVVTKYIETRYLPDDFRKYLQGLEG